MPNTMDWTSVATWERLVASIIASGVKLDLKTVASYYGTTYHTLENRLRKIKKDAELLKLNGEGGEDGKAASSSPAKVAPKTPRKPKTPKKDPLETVTDGRISKKTPSKKTPVKQESPEMDGSVEVAGGINTGSLAQEASSLSVEDYMFT